MWPNVSHENDAREFEKDVVIFDWTKMFIGYMFVLLWRRLGGEEV
jgi:hypothetical protein